MFDGHRHRRRRDGDTDFDPRRFRVVVNGLGGVLDGVPRIARRSAQAGLQPSDGDQRVDGSGHLLGVSMHGFEAGTVVTAASLSVQRKLGLGSDSRERRSQLVGELRGEALLMSDAGGQTLEEGVERGSELGELVVGFATVEALVEIVVAPGRRVLGHAGDGQQGLAEDPARQQGDGAEQENRKRDRADERDRRRLVVRFERDARHHGADPSRRRAGRGGRTAGSPP